MNNTISIGLKILYTKIFFLLVFNFSLRTIKAFSPFVNSILLVFKLRQTSVNKLPLIWGKKKLLLLKIEGKANEN